MWIVCDGFYDLTNANMMYKAHVKSKTETQDRTFVILFCRIMTPPKPWDPSYSIPCEQGQNDL